MGKPVKIIELAKQMIKLNGKNIKDEKNPSQDDIEIIFTGLRKGEKLFEELLINSNSEPTTHDRIFTAKEPFLEPKKLFKKLEVLESQINQLNKPQAIKTLKELVPDWSEPNMQ